MNESSLDSISHRGFDLESGFAGGGVGIGGRGQILVDQETFMAAPAPSINTCHLRFSDLSPSQK